MGRTTYSEVDNRDAGHMFEYMEARIEFMKRRIHELQAENNALREKASAPFQIKNVADGRNVMNWHRRASDVAVTAMRYAG